MGELRLGDNHRISTRCHTGVEVVYLGQKILSEGSRD